MHRTLRGLILAFTCFAGLAAAPAWARNVTADLDVLTQVLRAKGHKLEIKTVDKETYIRVQDPDGYAYNIFLYGCDDNNKNCQSVQFYAAFAPSKKPTLSAMNQYSKEYRYGRVYLDGDGDPNLEWDVYLSKAGMSEALFFENLDLWDAKMDNFGEFVFGKDGENEKPKS